MNDSDRSAGSSFSSPKNDLAVGPPAKENATTSPRRDALICIGEGIGFYFLGFVGLCLCFGISWQGRIKAVIGAGPLFGGGLIGFGIVKLFFGDRFAPLRWAAAIVGAFVGLMSALLGAALLTGVEL